MKTLISRACGAVTMRHRQCQRCKTEWWAQVHETILTASVVPGKLDEAKQLPLVPVEENIQPCIAVDKSEQIPAPRNSTKREDQDPDPECSEAGDALIQFPVVGKSRTWGLYQPFVDKLASAYPGVDVLAEARRALVWVDANPTKRKTATGMARFLANWVSRAQNSGLASRTAVPVTKSDRDRLYAKYPPIRKQGS